MTTPPNSPVPSPDGAAPLSPNASSGSPTPDGAASLSPDASSGSAHLPSEASPLEPVLEVRDVAGGSVVVVVMRRPDGKPATLGPAGLRHLTDAVAEASEQCEREGHLAVVLTGVGTTFLAGADLDMVTEYVDGESARELGRLGHVLVEQIMDAPVPTVALVNGTALGGGLEVALACRARLAVDDVKALGLPESHLGLIAGWGGSFLLPHLIGPEAAAKVLIENPLKNNRTLRAADALELGVVDAVAPADRDQDGQVWPADALGELLADMPREAVPERWAPEDEEGEVAAEAADAAEGVAAVGAAGTGGAGGASDAADAAAAVADGAAATDQAWADLAKLESLVDRAERGGRPAPRRALELLRGAENATRADAFGAEDAALADLVPTSQLHNTIHSMAILRAHRPGRAENTVKSVGVIGGGLMASQLAVLLAGKLRVPVVLRELDEERASRTRELLRSEIEKLGLEDARAEALGGLLTATVSLEDLADSDLVIEAVFEELAVKQQVFSEIEPLLREDAVLATNTSSLSITAMGEVLERPERLVGIHFFNPVARMPLVEIVRTPSTSEDALTTARALAWGAGKTTVEVADAPGFVVNRILLRLLAVVLESMERGTPPEVADKALEPIGLPMGPLHLLQLVGPAVANHVLVELHERLGERYPLSPGLDAVVDDGASFLTGPPSPGTPIDPGVARNFGASSANAGTDGTADDAPTLLRRVQVALADEIHRMIDEGVAERDAIDVAMITGAGWPLHRGGITKYLDEVGAAEEAGGRFH